MKKLLILIITTIHLIPNSGGTTVYAYEEPIAGFSTILDKVDPIENHLNTYRWTTDNVNLRSKPSLEADIIKTLDKREKVIFVSEKDDWTRVKYGENSTGYIYSKYLRDTEFPVIKYTDSEIKMLQRITEAEATGQSIEAKMNVTSCIINRVMSDEFPDDIESVIFQKSQFSPISDGRYYEVEIAKDTIKAVDKVVKNGVTHQCLFFSNVRDIEQQKYKEWFSNLSYCFSDNSGHSYFK